MAIVRGLFPIENMLTLDTISATFSMRKSSPGRLSAEMSLLDAEPGQVSFQR